MQLSLENINMSHVLRTASVLLLTPFPYHIGDWNIPQFPEPAALVLNPWPHLTCINKYTCRGSMNIYIVPSGKSYSRSLPSLNRHNSK